MTRRSAGAAKVGAVLAGMAMLALAPGCARDANALEGAVPAQPRLAAVDTRSVADATVTIIERGSEPRQALALQPVAGTVQRVTVSQSGQQTYSVGTETSTHVSPVVSVAATLRAAATDGDRVSVDVTFDAVTVDGAGADEIMVHQSRALVDGLNGATARITTDTSGRLIGSEPVLTGDDADAVVLGWIDRNVLSLADPLPAEPLGVGAVWTVSSSMPASGVPARVTRRYTITDITDTEVRATVQRSVVWAEGVHDDTIVLAGSEAGGAGQVVWPRAGLLGTVSYTLDGAIRYSLGDQDPLVQAMSRAVRSSLAVDTPPGQEPEPTAPPQEPISQTPATDPPASDPPATDPPTTEPAPDPGTGPAPGPPTTAPAPGQAEDP